MKDEKESEVYDYEEYEENGVLVKSYKLKDGTPVHSRVDVKTGQGIVSLGHFDESTSPVYFNFDSARREPQVVLPFDPTEEKEDDS